MPKSLKNATKLQTARKKAGLSQEAVAERLGVAHSTVQRAETGKTQQTVDQLKAFAAVYRVPLTDVIEFGHSFILLPVVGKVAAGDWRGAEEQPADDQQTVPYMPRVDRPIPDGALELEGDSMNEIWPENTLVFYKRITPNYVPTPRQRVVVERRRAGEVEVTCKEVRVTADGKVLLIPRSLNPAHQPVLLTGGEEDEILIWAVVVDTQQPEEILGTI